MRLPAKHGVGASRVVLPPGRWPSVLDFLAQRFKAASHEEWVARMERGDVLDEFGAALGVNAEYRPGATVHYYRHLRDEPSIPVEETILFQDEWLIVVDKPHFLPVISTGRFVRESLLARLKRKLQLDTLAPMHRIDRDTAGLVMFTIQPATRDRYAVLFRERTMHKEYEAIASFNPNLALPITHRSRLEEGTPYMQMREIQGEPNAETRIEILEARQDLARYKLSPITGKKHQLRAHMAALGMPIVNDRIYPVLQPHGADDYAKPLQLLAKTLTFRDPITRQLREFSSQRALHW